MNWYYLFPLADFSLIHIPNKYS